MKADDFLAKLMAEPFEPFQVIKRSGQPWPIAERDHAFITDRSIVYLFKQADGEEEGLMDGPEVLNVEQIERVIPLPGQRAAG